MDGLIIALGGVFAILMTSELLWRTKRIHGEAGRKFVHIGVGTYVAFWPYLITWRQIQIISVAFLVVILVSQQSNLFHAIHTNKHRTWGEILFPVGIGLSASITQVPIIFTAAILHLSLADGFAAIMGSKYGLRHRYKIMGHLKTMAGTLSFWLISILIIATCLSVAPPTPAGLFLPLVFLLPMAATLVENLAIGGLDNLFVPLLIILVLQTVQVM